MPSTQERAKASNRRQKVADLYLSGKSQSEIARQFDVSQRTISKDIEILQKEWKKNATMALDEVISKELSKIAKLEKTYGEAWEKSKEKTNGDPRFLVGIQWCMEQRMKIFGGYAPTKTENIEMRLPDLSQMTFDQLYLLKHGHKPNDDDAAND